MLFLDNLMERLQLLAVAEVATVAKAWHNVLLFVHALVDGGTSDGGTFRQ